MSAQLPLSLSHSVRYSSASFVEHAGVRSTIVTLKALSAQRGFSLAYIMGPKGSGKTHLGVCLVGKLHEEQGRDARFVSGRDLAEWYAQELLERPFQGGEVLVIDDADRALEELAQGGEPGIFVDIVERLANADGMLVLLGASVPERIRCGSQASSRLSAGLHFAIGDPQDADLDGLLDLMTKQRGLHLTESKRSYILRRVTRTLPALVACVERLEKGGDFESPSTSFELIAGAITTTAR